MINDLRSAISHWMNQGNHIVLAIDLNRNVVTSKEAYTFTSLGLIEAITNKYKDLVGLALTHQ